MVDKEQKKTGNPISNFSKQFTNFFRKLFRLEKKLIRRGSSWQDIRLDINAEANRYLEMRHVQEDEIKQVIFHAETTGEKLYQPGANRFLGKLKIGKVTFYADYSYGDDSFIVKYGYAHRSEIIG